MRTLLAVLVLALALSFSGRAADAATTYSTTDVPPGVGLQEGDTSDDDIVEVQLVVLGIILGTVFVAGTGAYLLRRRLGLTAYTPPKDSGHH